MKTTQTTTTVTFKMTLKRERILQELAKEHPHEVAPCTVVLTFRLHAGA